MCGCANWSRRAQPRRESRSHHVAITALIPAVINARVNVPINAVIDAVIDAVITE